MKSGLMMLGTMYLTIMILPNLRLLLSYSMKTLSNTCRLVKLGGGTAIYNGKKESAGLSIHILSCSIRVIGILGNDG